MKDSRVDLMIADVLSVPHLAAMDADVNVYQTGALSAQGICVAHDLQLRLNKVSYLELPISGRNDSFFTNL
jgi:hypothetical protein